MACVLFLQYEGGMTGVKHHFNIEIAKDIGINAAVVFENISYWIKHNEKAGRNKKDGMFWMYATQKDIAAQFEYLSVKQTRTALERLVEHGYLQTGRHNKHGYDRTSWYALTDKGASYCQTRRIIKPVQALRIAQEGEPIPNINPNIKPDIKHRAEELRRLIGQA
jgi:DNA-binding PadR family transcriptional regulator